MNPFRNDVLDEVVYHDSDVKLTPDMTRKFDKRTIEHIFEEVLPAAIELGDAKVAAACERLLSKHSLACPNHVSGFWEPMTVPRNELQVRELFASRLYEYGYRLVGSHNAFPDWLLLDEDNNFVYTEVEHRSSSFAIHGHDSRLCDLVACWEHDWPECPLPVLEFFSGRTIQPKSGELPCKSMRARLPVNFSGALSRSHTGRNLMDKAERGEHAVMRYAELSEGGDKSDQQVCREIGLELGVTSQAVRQMLYHRGIIGPGPRESRREQMRSRFNEIQEDFDTKSAAIEVIANEFGVKTGTVWSNLSRKR